MPSSSAIMERSTRRAYRAILLIANARNSGLLQCARCRETVAVMSSRGGRRRFALGAPAPSPAMNKLGALLRAGGKRMTIQRRLVLEALERARHHTTAEEIAVRIRKQHPQIDPSTVYRNLEALEGLGYVTHTHFEDRITRWHLADAHRHGHLVCRQCGAELEVPMTLLEPLARRLRAEHGFQADLAHSAVVGICRTCASVSST